VQTDDLAAQMVREMGLDGLFDQDVIEECEAIARRYMEKAVDDALELASRIAGQHPNFGPRDDFNRGIERGREKAASAINKFRAKHLKEGR